MSDVARVFVYCDNHNTRIPVTNFDLVDGRWTEVGATRSRRMSRGEKTGLGIVLVGPENDRVDTYMLYDLPCHKCGRKVSVQERHLFPTLHAHQSIGSVSLTDIAANI